jgi:excinuclease ABC subunit C
MDLSIVVNPGLGNFHVFGYYEDENKAYINYLYVFDGSIVKAKNLTISRKLNESNTYLLAHAILETLGTNEIKEEILVPFPIDDLPDSYSISIPKLSDKRKLLDLATKNAFLIKQNELKRNSSIPREERILQLIKEELQLKHLPRRIECFDNSNIQGKFPVASMVVFKNAKPSKADYRHYNVKTVEGPNDFASMEEIVYRRYKGLMEEGESLPDLIVIDGGKGQLASALKSLEKLGIIDQVEIISIAKRLEEIYFPGDALPLHISKRSETLKVLQHIRNEAHRFAITFHRNQRSKGTIRSQLTDIKGIGQKTAALLLHKLGSVKKIKETSLEELESIIGKSKASIIYKSLHTQN